MAKFTDLKCCPFCGADEYYNKTYACGAVKFKERYDGKEAYNGELHEGLCYKGDGNIVYCAECHKRIGNTDTNTLTKQAERALKEHSQCQEKK